MIKAFSGQSVSQAPMDKPAGWLLARVQAKKGSRVQMLNAKKWKQHVT